MQPALSRREAQRRTDRIRAFRDELAQLRAEGALELSPEQQERLEAHLAATLGALASRFDVETTDSEKRIAWGMRIASTIAGLAFCAAVVLFFLRIWGGLGVPLQVALLAGTPLALIAAMEWTSRRERTLYYTALLGIVAFASAVLNLNALGAMFNLGGSPEAFLVWAVFGLALAYAYRLRLLLAAGLVCGIIFAVTSMLVWSGHYWGQIDARVETWVAAGALAVAVPSVVRHQRAADFPWVYQVTGLSAAFLGMLAGSMNGSLTYLPFTAHTAEILWQFTGMAVAALAIWQGIARGVPGVVNLSAGAFILFLYIRLYRWWWDWMPRYLFFLIVGLLSLALLFGFQRMRRRIAARRAV